MPTPKKFETFWTQFDATGNLCLRLISQSVPPNVFLNGHVLPLKKRCDPSPNFPIYVWEAPLIKGGQLRIEDKEIFLPHSFEKVFFLGDTGCRPYQAPSAWPFKHILQKVPNEDPDLIIHLGDYIYRHLKAQIKYEESPLHLNEGDNWWGWRKEFFDPAAEILPSIPWVFVRGNQENQDCAPEGWFRFFDGHPYTAQYPLYTPAYTIPLDKVTLIVHDSSYLYPEEYPGWPSTQLAQVEGLLTSESWLLTHRPIWGLVMNPSSPAIIINDHSNLEAFLEPFPSNITTIFSGHIHAFQAIKLVESPIQLFVIGNSGVALENAPQVEEIRHTYISGKKIEYALSLVEFGYGIAEYHSSGWDFKVKNKNATSLLNFIPPQKIA